MLSTTGAHVSFHHLYDAGDPQAVPFYDGPNLASNAEQSVFLSLPTKRNAAHHLNAAPTTATHVLQGVKALGNGAKRAIARLGSATQIDIRDSASSASNAGDLLERSNSQARLLAPQYLDFKEILLPTILALVQPVPHVALNNSTNQPFGNTVPIKSHFPVRNPTSAYDNYNDLAADAEEEAEESRLQLLKTTELLLPTESQWYALNQMRIHAGAPERSFGGIEKLAHYYAQLVYLEQKFPFETGKMDVTFIWFEAFADDKKSSENPVTFHAEGQMLTILFRLVITSCIQYEKASVLYNMGSIFSQLAAGEQLWTSAGKKHASAYFQKAAGVFIFIRDALCNRYRIRVDKSSDVSEQTLTASAQLMLAQALECFYGKATEDHVSSPITAQIAAQCADYYQIAQRSAKSNNGFGKIRYPREWVSQMKTKYLLLTAIAHFHTPSTLPAAMQVAERVTRLTVARGYAFQASKAARDTSAVLRDVVDAYTEVIVNALLATDSANFDLHHQTTVDVRLLVPIKRPSDPLVAPPTATNVLGPLNRFQDLFHAVIAPNHHEDVRNFLQDCGRIVEAGRIELSNSVVEIDAKVAALGLSLASSKAEDDGKDGGATTSEDAFQRANPAMLIEQIKVYQKEEVVISSEEMIKNLRRLQEIIGGNLQESLQILDRIEIASLGDSNLVNQVSILRQSAVEMTDVMRERKLKLEDLYLLYETEIAEFSPLGWSEEKLKAILPCLDTPSATLDDTRSRLTAARLERGIFLAKISDTRAECLKKFEEVQNFGTGLDVLKTGEDLDVSAALNARRKQLKVLEDTIRQTRKEKDELLAKIESLTKSIMRDTAGVSEEEQSRAIVDSFKTTFAHYAVFREETQNEIKKCLRLREESAGILVRCHKFTGSKGSGDSRRSSPGRNREKLLPHPSGLDRDPMVTNMMASDSRPPSPYRENGRASTPHQSAPSSPTRVASSIPGVKVPAPMSPATSADSSPDVIMPDSKATEEIRQALQEALPHEGRFDVYTLGSLPGHPSDPQVESTEDYMKRLISTQQAEIERLGALHKNHEAHIRELQKQQRTSSWAALEALASSKSHPDLMDAAQEPLYKQQPTRSEFLEQRPAGSKRAQLLEVKRRPSGAPIKYVSATGNEHYQRPPRIETARVIVPPATGIASFSPTKSTEKMKSGFLKFWNASGRDADASSSAPIQHQDPESNAQARPPHIVRRPSLHRPTNNNIALEPSSRKTSYATAIEILHNGQRVPSGFNRRVSDMSAFGAAAEDVIIDNGSDLHSSELNFFEVEDAHPDPAVEARYETLIRQIQRLRSENVVIRQSSAKDARKLRKVLAMMDAQDHVKDSVTNHAAATAPVSRSATLPVRYPSVSGLFEQEQARSSNHDSRHPTQLQEWVAEQRRALSERGGGETVNVAQKFEPSSPRKPVSHNYNQEPTPPSSTFRPPQQQHQFAMYGNNTQAQNHALSTVASVAAAAAAAGVHVAQTGQTVMMMSYGETFPESMMMHRKRNPVASMATAEYSKVESGTTGRMYTKTRNAVGGGNGAKGKYPFDKGDSGIGASGASLSNTTDDGARVPKVVKRSEGKKGPLDPYSKMKRDNDQVVGQLASLPPSSSASTDA
ncbi:hypothetical protein SmJEL517_g02652 [Synchytrium microbalum]|uniref:BRO domain-containing protein 1 n=1 Tax=Synchytrium microbalum TaxID=1806994 RepID=A0A507C5T9_9FUNG|nr:uncharacterized protein SmJEL517_g02652 [Synchytrium microbalum]TPX34871.1 hypothetical protein SmJEL517_g02652 [Synchytrium microbalum]